MWLFASTILSITSLAFLGWLGFALVADGFGYWPNRQFITIFFWLLGANTVAMLFWLYAHRFKPN